MIINKTNLQKALGYVSPGLANKEVIEQATSFVFMDGQVMTFNDRISICHPMEELKDLHGAIQAEQLYKLLSKVKREEMDISMHENSEVILKCGKMKVEFTLQREIKLPFDSLGKKGKWKSIPENMIKAMIFTSMACSRDMSRPELTGIHFSDQGWIEASDSYRIARYNMEVVPIVKPFLLGADEALEVGKLNPTEIAEGTEGWIHFRTEQGTVISCRLIDNVFPDTTPFLRVKGTKLELPKKTIDILDRAIIFSKRDHVLDETVNITIKNNQFKVTSSSDTARFEEQANIAYDGPVIEFPIIPYLLRDILNETLTCVIGENRLKFTGDNWVYISSMRAK